MMRHTWRAVGLVSAMLAGVLSPWAAELSAYIKWPIFFMLWLAFLDAPIGWNVFDKRHGWILLALVALAFGSYVLVLPFGEKYALVAFIIAITPTATAAPSVISMLGGNPSFVAVSVVLSHLGISLFLPLVLPWLGGQKEISVMQMLIPSAQVAVLPMVAAFPLRFLPAGMFQQVVKLKKFSLCLWLLVLFMVTSRASQFVLTHADVGWKDILIVAALAAVICVASFSSGYWLGGKRYAREVSQCLGQKNTMLTIWISLHFLTPFVALGPTLYIVCHNLFNSWQLLHVKPRQK